MKKIGRYGLAICTLWVVMTCASTRPALSATSAENFAHYSKSLRQWGATALTLPAHIEYRAARVEMGRGNHEDAERHLEEAVKLDPNFADAYFTMSWLKFRSFDADALYLFVRGFNALWHDFRSQSLLAINGILIASLLLVLVSIITCISLAIRYLPFVAHRFSEMLSDRFHAVLPKFTAHLLVLIPFLLFPGFVTGFCILLVMTWYFMHKREKFTMIALIVPFILLAVFSSRLQRLSPVADPASFVSLAAKSTHAPGDAALIKDVTSTEANSLEAEKNVVQGVLRMRSENYETAANHFLRAISLRPEHPVAYVNLGNVYYLQGRYEKALEGYRKAERLDPNDAVGQYNLAQAYIKTLLLAESSKALKNASAAGIDKVQQSFAESVRPKVQIYPKTFSNAELWRIAGVEGAHQEVNVVDDVLKPITRFSIQASAWLMGAALLLSLLLSRLIKERHLSFQCSNCGELTSESSSNADRGVFICQACADSIAGVSSDKVIEALLRQRRQAEVVKRRKVVRFFTGWLPGVRDIFYGRITRGLTLAVIFSFSLIQLWTKGYIVKDWDALIYPTPLWKWIAPAVGIALAYLMSISSRQYFEVRNYRTPSLRQRMNSTRDEEPAARNYGS